MQFVIFLDLIVLGGAEKHHPRLWYINYFCSIYVDQSKLGATKRHGRFLLRYQCWVGIMGCFYELSVQLAV